MTDAQIPPELCGFAIGDRTGQCVFLPHRLGTAHSWAPDIGPLFKDSCPECGVRAEWYHRFGCSRKTRDEYGL